MSAIQEDDRKDEALKAKQIKMRAPPPSRLSFSEVDKSLGSAETKPIRPTALN